MLIISNPERRAAVGLQRLGKAPGDFMVWDYHVVGLLKTSDGAALVDFDTSTESTVLDAHWWLDTQAKLLELVNDAYLPLFRPISAERYLSEFSSTRRHMLHEDGSYIHPPPSWDCIRSDSERLSELESLLEASPLEGWHKIEALAQLLRLEHPKDPRC